MNALEKQVLLLIGEDADSPDVFVDTDDGIKPIRDSINDAIQEISALTGSYKRSYPITLIEDKSFYRLKLNDGEIGWVTDAWLVNQSRRLTQTDVIALNHLDPRWLESSGTPTQYIPIGQDIIVFYPRPSSTTDVVDLSCAVIPAAYTMASDRIKLLGAFKRATVHYAVSEYWASRGSALDAKFHFDKYINILGIRDIHPQQAEYVPQLKAIKGAA